MYADEENKLGRCKYIFTFRRIFFKSRYPHNLSLSPTTTTGKTSLRTNLTPLWSDTEHWPYAPGVCNIHYDVTKWKHLPRYWPFVRGLHRSPVNSPHKGQLREALIFSLICVWINGWVNNREAGDLRRYRAHYDVSVMSQERRDEYYTADSLNTFFAITSETCIMEFLREAGFFYLIWMVRHSIQSLTWIIPELMQFPKFN